MTNPSARVLNSLIATTLDSIDGYEESAKDVKNPEYRAMFTRRASERREMVDGLKAAVRTAGAEPEDDGTLLAAAHRVFVNLKSIVTGADDQAVINEVERGEDHLKAKFDAALKDTDLTPEARTAIEQANVSVQQGHAEASRLKHALETN